MGFYFAEGTKSKDSIAISNKEFKLIQKSINIFEEEFNIPKSSWKLWIRSANKEEFGKEKLKTKWAQKTDLNTSVIFSKLAYEESLEIRINSRVLSSQINNFFNNNIKEICNNKEYAKHFLRGYFIGDGSISLRNKQIHGIHLTVKEEKYKEILIKVLKFLYEKEPNVRITKGAYDISYCDVNIITKTILDKIFIDLDRQWKKLIKGYKNKQYTRARIKYWNKITEIPLNPYEIAILSGNSHWSVRDALNKDIKLGLVEAKYKHINRTGAYTKYYSLSKEGERLYKTIKEVK